MNRFLKDIIVVLLLPILVVFLAVVFYFANRGNITGDLGKMNQMLFPKEYRTSSKFAEEQSVYLHRKDCLDSISDTDVLCIGDSFSKLTVFPEALSNSLKRNVGLFCDDWDLSPEQVLINIIDSINAPKVVVLESVERYFVERLCGLDFRWREPISHVENSHKSSWVSRKVNKIATFYKNNIFRGDAVKSANLLYPLFTCSGNNNKLLFYQEDLIIPTEDNVLLAKRKLDTLFSFAKERNIDLYYIVASDKYDIYQNFIDDNSYPKKQTLDAFARYVGSNSHFLNSKDFLLPMAERGVTDVYYVDDTHWSPVGAKVVADSVAARIMNIE